MIKTIKEIETKIKTTTYFYDEDGILIAKAYDEEIITTRELTEDEKAEIRVFL